MQQTESATRDGPGHAGASILPIYQGHDGKRYTTNPQQNTCDARNKEEAGAMGRSQAKGEFRHDQAQQTAEKGEIGQAQRTSLTPESLDEEVQSQTRKQQHSNNPPSEFC